MMEQERKAFEDYAMRCGYDMTRYCENIETYNDSRTQICWYSWQARANLPTHGGTIYAAGISPEQITKILLDNPIPSVYSKPGNEHSSEVCSGGVHIPTPSLKSLLSAIIILPEGAEPEIGDLIAIQYYRGDKWLYGILIGKTGVTYRIQGHASIPKEDIVRKVILQRQGKPVVYQNELEKAK